MQRLGDGCFSYILNFASPYIPVLYCVLVPTACVHIIHIVNFHPATMFLLHGSISIIQRIYCCHACRLNITYNIITLYLTVFILLRLMSTTYILAITCLRTTSIVYFATLLPFFTLISSVPLLHCSDWYPLISHYGSQLDKRFGLQLTPVLRVST